MMFPNIEIRELSLNIHNDFRFNPKEISALQKKELETHYSESFQRKSSWYKKPFTFDEKIEHDWKIIESFGFLKEEVISHTVQIFSKAEQIFKEHREGSIFDLSVVIQLSKNSIKEIEYRNYFIKRIEKTERNILKEEENSLSENDTVETCTEVIRLTLNNRIQIDLNRNNVGYLEQFGLFVNPHNDTKCNITPLKILSFLTGINKKVFKRTLPTLNLKPIHSINNNPYITSRSELTLLTKINGLSIEVIESRARPNAYSNCGFIGDNESLIELMQKDFETIESLNTTPAELAAHLRNIIEIAFRTKKVVEYDPSTLEGNTFPEGIRKFIVDLVSTRGYQLDIFAESPFCGDKLQKYLKDDGTLHPVSIPKSWSDEPVIINLENMISLKVTEGSIGYLEEFAFCGGNESNNPYRIDPKKAFELLSCKASKIAFNL